MKKTLKKKLQQRNKVFHLSILQHDTPQKNNPYLQTTLQSIVKPTIVPNYSHLDYQKISLLVTTKSQSRKRNYNLQTLINSITQSVICID